MISTVSSVWYLGVILELDASSPCEAHFTKYPLGEVAQAQAVGLADPVAASKVNRRPNWDTLEINVVVKAKRQT